jgi:hypothetical protein
MVSTKSNVHVNVMMLSQKKALINKLLSGGATCLSGRIREDNWGKKNIAIISAYEHTKLKLTFFML